MSSFGAPSLMFDALDGSKYKTGIDGWSEQVLRSTGDKVFVKLINLGDKTRLIAIDHLQAINTGVDNQLSTKTERSRAQTAKKPKPTSEDYKLMQKDAEKIAAVHRDAMGGTATKAKGAYPWAKDRSTVRVGDRITKPVVVTTPNKTTNKPAVDTSVAGMISNEAKRLNKKG